MRPNRHPLDEDSVSRMLQGTVHPDDAPPGYGAVAGLLASAAQPAPVDEDAAATTVSAMVEAIRGSASTPQMSRRTSMLKKLLAGKALAAVGIVALTASGAAAATGSLPDPVQGVVAGAVSHVGVDLPQPGDQGKSAGHRQDGAHRPDGQGDGSTTSSTAGSDDNSSDNQGHGQQISDLAHQTKAEGGPVGPTVCAAASDGKCQAGSDNHGKGTGPGDDEGPTPSTAGSAEDHDTTPTTGSIETGDDHNDDHATTPTTGSAVTGQDHSGRDVGPSDSGKGDSGSQH